MILITDGGSTKCDWILLDAKGEVVLKTRTEGLNPAVVPEESLIERIQSNSDLPSLFNKEITLDFYGAGCGTKTPAAILLTILSELFVNAKVTVNEDTVAAVYAATTEPGIVCILGTGSNSSYFDGKEVFSNVASLGYTLMDEASGNYFGKRLLRDYFYKKMPSVLATEFEKRFNLDPDEIKLNLYKRPNPNMYLASFAEFIFNPGEERPNAAGDINGYFYKLISEGILKFIEYRILCYKEAQHVPIHFIGSIAYFSEDIIRDCMKPYHLELGNIIRRPIDGLIAYYKANRLKPE
ncbi:N-acetylglucosamine kinase [Ulvibacter antarcticus]|uniref:N-acetylglucosamine kinase-like BadF-type ATPase n=1 Tax=Ulvibacter antarcticus TaxID=442714 RepID=A0A3L9YWJ2_9FLAO|nr:N-acetylglucosamine kinase [Ulvibacter antarcticus]RMA58842.1 N-acetylglucosamine kinase-like BadF-type ATPase [Ulvibacter antarcticus]